MIKCLLLFNIVRFKKLSALEDKIVVNIVVVRYVGSFIASPISAVFLTEVIFYLYLSSVECSRKGKSFITKHFRILHFTAMFFY